MKAVIDVDAETITFYQRFGGTKTFRSRNNPWLEWIDTIRALPWYVRYYMIWRDELSEVEYVSSVPEERSIHRRINGKWVEE